jgi:hypothetical protein
LQVCVVKPIWSWFSHFRFQLLLKLMSSECRFGEYIWIAVRENGSLVVLERAINKLVQAVVALALL